jgi:TRIAD3 protein (E3 ubiquitin-protein ligase RNF216)
MAELEESVPEKTLMRLFATETQKAIADAGIKELVRCHKCGFCAEFDACGNLRCPECGSDTCRECGSVAHGGMSCEEFGRIDKGRIVEEKMNEAVVRVCPKCAAQFMKEEGCNKMECPRCHTWICYWYRKEIPKHVGYAHFWRADGPCPLEMCPLWAPTDTLHKLEAARAEERTKEDFGNLSAFV